MTDMQKSWALHLGIIALLFVLQFILPAYHHGSLARIMVLTCYAMGYNILFGYTGLLSLGLQVAVVADDAADVRLELTGLYLREDGVETVPLLRHHQCHALWSLGVGEPPLDLHPQFTAKRTQPLAKCLLVK